MPPLVVSNAVLVRLIWSAGGVPFAVNVLGGRKISATTIDQGFANTLGSAIKGAISAVALVPQLHTSVALMSVGVRDISAAARPEFIDAGTAVNGTGTGNLLPPQVAICCTLRTALAGKSFRGRYYQAGMPVGANSATGTILAAASTPVRDFISALRITHFPSNGLALAVISRKNAVATDVTLEQVRDAQWDTQRRRAEAGV